MAFKPQPIPADDLTARLREGMSDIPRVTPNRPPEPVQESAPEDDPPLRAAPPDDVPRRFTSFRLPVALDEELRAMMFETRRSKQDLMTEFVTEGVRRWRQGRVRRG